MSIRYKFRSSVNFDSVDIGGRPSISVRDLKSKIVLSKKLNICQDFDLVFSDAQTGQEYVDENFLISSGSSVIIKRVPAGSVPSNRAHNDSFPTFGTKDKEQIKNPCTANVEINFDDFGVDLCPVPAVTLSCSDIDIVKETYIGGERKNFDGTRCPGSPTFRCKKLGVNDLTEAIPKGPVHSGIEEDTLETKLKPNAQQCMKLENAAIANPPTTQSTIFPSELKCSLCNTWFKEAVMIPCCQHSFCEKCIHSVLFEKARCPMCLSSKFKVQDLLPNVSLRQAIEHFLQSQILISGTENALHDYAPDGESGIQAKDVSYAATNLQREPQLPDSLSATGRGSNQIVAESAYDSLLRNNASVGGIGSCVNQLGGDKSLKSCLWPHKTKQIDGERPVDLDDFADCEGENQPIHEEVESSVTKKRALSINTSGVDKSFMQSGRLKKGNRTCYMCGSPDHFIRDCPVASSPNTMLQTGNGSFPHATHGYVSPYWNGPPLPHVRPFANIYGNPGMMPFNPTMVPAPPFAGPMYMPCMFGGPPAYGGFGRMGGATAPIAINTERHLFHSEILDHQGYEKKRKLSNENMSAQSSDDDDYHHFKKRCHFSEAERSDDRRSRISRERSVSYSEESFMHRPHKRHLRDTNLDNGKYPVDEKHEKNSHSSISGRERRPHHSERSSEVENIPSSSSWHADVKHKNQSRNSKKHSERREQCCSDSSCVRHPSNNEKNFERKRLRSDVERHKQKHSSHSDSGLEPSYPGDKKKLKERDFSHVSRHSRLNSRFMDDESSHDRWLMVRGSDENCAEDYCYEKGKRITNRNNRPDFLSLSCGG
ncbi:E3 ubiquitin ligase PQT3-like isoform X2 [Pistacia vera]|uniref:E3 ubiquitin ligase PQT3-like isoform X2 n=1 Tax=Pistacia vera TaxID=55513 RepID=UPI0012632116|nr:E3 ubiquitin ligase PQT3-like isoform X2 [Pistacia vera]